MKEKQLVFKWGKEKCEVEEEKSRKADVEDERASQERIYFYAKEKSRHARTKNLSLPGCESPLCIRSIAFASWSPPQTSMCLLESKKRKNGKNISFFMIIFMSRVGRKMNRKSYFFASFHF